MLFRLLITLSIFIPIGVCLGNSLPAQVVESFKIHAAGFAIVPGTDSVIQGDFNCDGEPDYALVAKPLKAQLANTVESQVFIALSSPGGFEWRSRKGAWVHKRGVLGKSLLALARADISNYRKNQLRPGGFDFDWAVKHRCEVLSIGRDHDKPGIDLLWDHKTKKFVEAYFGEC